MAKKGGAPTKSEILAQVSKDTELSRKQVSEVFESLNGIIKKSLRGNGLFTLPGLLKLKVVKRPATKAREGVNPFTGEKMTFQGEARQQEGARAAVEELEVLRELTASRAAFSSIFYRTPGGVALPGFLRWKMR